MPNPENLTPHQFKKGVSGNPGGRPKGGLKAYDRAKFEKMSDDEKDEFLKTLTPELRYRMAEGNPATNTDLKLDGVLVVQIAKEIAEKHDIDTSTEDDSKG